MPKFQSIPETVEAEQWLPGKRVASLEYHCVDGSACTVHKPFFRFEGILIEVSSGDWIITHKDGSRKLRTDSEFKCQYKALEA